MQHSSHLLMIKPVHFDFNEETAVNNSFQTKSADIDIQVNALMEFETFIAVLQSNGIDVTVINDTPDPHTPDSIFPNNWISFHEKATVCLYPMFAGNRRLERKQHVLDEIQKKFGVNQIIDLTEHEAYHAFLEGTGSMVLDRDHALAYACLSPRTDKNVLTVFCEKLDYQPVYFTAFDSGNQPIYHTNVMMCVADAYAVICLETIHDRTERQMVVRKLTETGKKIIEISIDQMNHFAGNMLQVHNADGTIFLVMSSQAFRSLTEEQVLQLEAFNPIIHSDITTIETNGGGSARCMMAEIFLPLKPYLIC
ncbi:MAG: arginine deiminase-related protein [Sediminibacterium sp.]|nr:arginine deiminase-related protein [Sediminibacterium sp.]